MIGGGIPKGKPRRGQAGEIDC